MTRALCLALAALLFPLASKRPEPIQMDTSEVVITLAASSTCTPGACARACVAWVNNVWCIAGASYCRGDNTCYCQPVCLLQGQKPHVELTCENRIDSTQP